MSEEKEENKEDKGRSLSASVTATSENIRKLREMVGDDDKEQDST